ncbi:MAG: FAD-dependent thymidylate synthase [archaeon]
MRIDVVGTPNVISTLEGAKRYCQNFARVCYASNSFGEIRKEGYNSGLVDERLIKSGHHSVFDHFNVSLYLDGLPKVMAMVLNNEPPLATSEKSARYTAMEGMSERQEVVYDKWMGIFVDRIGEVFPIVDGRDVKIRKLAQENARYMTSVFTPTKMGYTISLRQLNILADNFEKFEGEIRGDGFKQRLFREGMIPFLASEVVKRFRINGLEDKSYRGVKLFGDEVEEHFGESVYSANLVMSFACLAQNHRHRAIHNHIVDGWDEGASMGFFVPPIIQTEDLSNEWCSDLENVAERDFPQAQLLKVAERGLREDLEMKLRERNCGLAQLEIVRVMDGLLKRYSEQVPKMGKLRGASCIVSKDGCKKGGCSFGAKHAIDRVI